VHIVVTIRLGNKLLFNSRNNHILLQGYGLYTMEELKFDKNGRLTTRNAMGYKIPRVTNVPRQFNVTLLKDSSNPYGVYSAKVYGTLIEEYIATYIYIYIVFTIYYTPCSKTKTH